MLDNIKENCIIEVKGLIENENDSDNRVELVTNGKFAYENDIYYISYDESEIVGFDGCNVTIKIYGNKKVIIERRGKISSDMVVEENIRTICNYETPYGNLMVGIEGKSFDIKMIDGIYKVKFRYLVDVNGVSSYINDVNLKIIRNTP